MLEAIDQAEHDVRLEMYTVGDDQVGQRFREALTACAARGRRVRVVFDSVGSLELPNTFWDSLVEAGGTVLEYAPISPLHEAFSLPKTRFRNHRKLLIVDEQIAFTGGINLALPWDAPASGGGGFRDNGIEIRGPASAQAVPLFESTWRRANGRVAFGTRPQPSTDDAVTFVADRVARRSYRAAIQGANRSIDIAASYFIPTRRMLAAIVQAAKSGVRVRLLLPHEGDVWIAQRAMQALLWELIESEIEIYRYRGGILHAKTAIIDKNTTIIGSLNLDGQSLRFNREINAVVHHEAFAATVTASFEDDLTQSTRLTRTELEQIPLVDRMIDAVAAQFRDFL